jgi:hypothetical protein
VHDLAGLTGVGSEKIRWGDTPYNGKSGYDFEGHGIHANLDGTEFLLGKLTHHNQTIPLPKHWQFWVHLDVNVHFVDEDIPYDFKLRFYHEETPNQGPDPDDVVKLPHVHESPVVYVDDVEYTLEITGFLQGQGAAKKRVSQFRVREGYRMSAGIFARFQRTSPPGS